MNKTTISTKKISTTNVILAGIILFQWFLFTLTLSRKPECLPPTTLLGPSEGMAQEGTDSFDGVAATMLFRSPRWFHLRYTNMILNALSNIPNSWAVQIFVNRDWLQSADVLEWHPALKRLLQDTPNRIIITDIPENLTRGKPKSVLNSVWFWETLAADHVLLFSGNGAFCTHATAKTSFWEALVETDFCGVPDHGEEEGGDGSTHSYRNRQAMLRLLQQHGVHDTGSESSSILHAMKDANKKGAEYRLANHSLQYVFGGSTNLLAGDNGIIHVPVLVSGTQASLPYDQRESLLKHCPELKSIFPSMHEPACFGAHPDPVKCKASICALQDPLPKHGC